MHERLEVIFLCVPFISLIAWSPIAVSVLVLKLLFLLCCQL